MLNVTFLRSVTADDDVVRHFLEDGIDIAQIFLRLTIQIVAVKRKIDLVELINLLLYEFDLQLRCALECIHALHRFGLHSLNRTIGRVRTEEVVVVLLCVGFGFIEVMPMQTDLQSHRPRARCSLAQGCSIQAFVLIHER